MMTASIGEFFGVTRFIESLQIFTQKRRFFRTLDARGYPLRPLSSHLQPLFLFCSSNIS